MIARYLVAVLVAVTPLVGAPPTASSRAPAQQVLPDRPIRWLAAGDSYSSGEGLTDVSDWPCQRAEGTGGHTSEAWSEVARRLLEQRHPGRVDLAPGRGRDGGFDFVACTGAVTADLFDDRRHKREWDPGHGRFDLMTFTFGGNDIGFAGIIKNCIGWSTTGRLAAAVGWLSTVGCPAQSDILAHVHALSTGGNVDDQGRQLTSLADFYRRIAATVMNPGGHVLVVGYPQLVEEPSRWSGDSRTLATCHGIRAEDVSTLRTVGVELNRVIREAVMHANDNLYGVRFDFVDVTPSFEPASATRHGLCAGDPWLNGISLGLASALFGRSDVSFHPMQAAHDAIGRLVVDRIRALDWTGLASTDRSPWIGSWAGLVAGADAGSVRLLIDPPVAGTSPNVGTFEYPERSCGGVLTLETIEPRVATLTETTTWGSCPSGGRVELEPAADDTLRWRGTISGRSAVATLSREATAGDGFDAVALDPASWTSVGGAETTEPEPGVLRLSSADTYWPGAVATPAGQCDYRFAGSARLVDGDGYGFYVRTAFDAAGTPTAGHGFQFDPGAAGLRDVELPRSEDGPVSVSATDREWHEVFVDVTGHTVRSYLDGRLQFVIATAATCGEVWLRIWRSTAEFEDLRIQPVPGR